MTTDWQTFFDGLADDSPLYREQSVLYVDRLAATVGLHERQRVLDFGCGFGFVGALLAPRVAQVWLWDPSPNMRRVAERNTAALPNVAFRDLPDRSSVDEAASGGERRGWPDGALDLILVNSVAQYMAPEELPRWLHAWQGWLAPGGMVVLSDLISRDHRGYADALDLLRLGARNGSAFRAAREALGGVGHYWRTSRAVPLTPVDRDDLARHAVDAGLEIEVLPHNLTHFRRRWSAVLRLPHHRSG